MRRGSYTTLRWAAIALLFLAVVLLVFQLVRYSRLRSSFPPGTTIAGIPMGGLDPQQAADRLISAYNIPLTLYYGDSTIQVRPSSLGFQLDLSAMITAADIQRTQQPFWTSFWDYLWNRLPNPISIPLRADISDERLKSTLLMRSPRATTSLPARRSLSQAAWCFSRVSPEKPSILKNLRI